MGKADVESVCKEDEACQWSGVEHPHSFRPQRQGSRDYGVKPGVSVLLTFNGNPMAILEVEEVYDYDKKSMCKDVYGTDEAKHPGVCTHIRVQG